MSNVKRVKCKVLLLQSSNTQVSSKGQIYLATHDPDTSYKLRVCNEVPNSPTSYRKECVKQDLYILSDEEIKEGDWRTHLSIDDEGNEQIIIIKHDKEGKMCSQAKKIIATTDESIKEHDDSVSFPKMRPALPQPSPPFIEKYVNEYNKGNVITDVLVDYEEFLLVTKDDILDSNNTAPHIWMPKTDKNNCITISKVKDIDSKIETKSIQKRSRIHRHGIEVVGTGKSYYFNNERLYSKDHVIELMFASSHRYYEMGNIDSHLKKLKSQVEIREDFDQYIEKNKNNF